MHVTEVFLVASLVLFAAMALVALTHLRDIRDSLNSMAESLERKKDGFPPGTCDHHDGYLVCKWPLSHRVERRFVVWTWAGSEWHVDSETELSAADRATHPRFPGAYAGHSVKVEAP